MDCLTDETIIFNKQKKKKEDRQRRRDFLALRFNYTQLVIELN